MVDSAELRRAAGIIRSGGLVAFPTETVYGLGANALDAAAVNRIFEAKGRPPTSPLIVHVSSPEMARSITAEWPDAADKLTARFWPGPLTLVLPKRPSIPDRVTAGLPTVGVRMPAHPIALALLEAAGVPIAAPSANKFTQISPTTAAHVKASLGDQVDMILDGGPTDVGIESTVLSLAGPPTLLRPGIISRAEIEAIAGPLRDHGEVDEGAHPAPGMHHRHYSPRTPLVIGYPRAKDRVAYIWFHTPRQAQRSVQLSADPAGYATALYRTLHDLDAEGWDCIMVEPVPDTPEWAGIADRLRRAATRHG